MNNQKAKEIKYAVLKELRRFDFNEWCESWGLTCEEVEEFLDNSIKYIDSCRETNE